MLALFVTARGAAAQSTTTALVDHRVTVSAGATISVAAGEALERVERQFIPVTLFAERGASRRAANIGYRFLKLGFFDLPQERFIQVGNHEIAGHGGRLRERFNGPISYSIDVPWPYGPGGGATSFAFDRQPGAYELLAVNGGGMEADGVAAGLTFRRAVLGRATAPRDALRYLLFELDTFRYVLLTGDGPQEPGEDVADWLDVYNGVSLSAGGRTLSARQLRREVLVSLANPMLAYAAFGIARYVWNGNEHVSVPALRIHGIRYLPMMRYRLAPYGTELSIVNTLAGASRDAEITWRVGRSPRSTPWGIGAVQYGVATWKDWRFDAGVNVWRQAALGGDPLDIDPTVSRLGVELRGAAGRPLIPVWVGSRRATVIIDVAAKSRGYVPGEPLGGGVVVRAGIGFPF